MNIGIDVDNTLANLAGAVYRYWNARHPEDPKPRSAFFSWQSRADLGVDTEEFFGMLRASWTLWASHMYPMDRDASMEINKLHEAGHSIHIITNRDLANHIDVVQFLKSQHIGYDAFSIIDRGGIPKLSFPIDVLIDDHPRVADEAKDWPHKRVLLYDQPWNRHIKAAPNLIRISGMRHAADLILKGVV